MPATKIVSIRQTTLRYWWSHNVMTVACSLLKKGIISSIESVHESVSEMFCSETKSPDAGEYAVP